MLLLADVFEDFRKQYLKTYDLDPANFLTLPSLPWQACLKTTKIKLHLITNQEMMLLIEQGIKGGLTQVITKTFVTNNEYLQDYDKNKDSTFLQYLDLNILYAWAMCQKLPHKNFEFCKDLRYINPKFIKNYDKDSSQKGYILKADIEYPKDSYLQNEHQVYHFYLKKLKLINKQNVQLIFMIKQDTWFISNYCNKL